MPETVQQLSYLDFEIEIGAGAAGSYPVRVVHSPAGELHSTLHMPFPMSELRTRLLELENAMLSASLPRRRVNTTEEAVARQWGKQLFDVLFSGEICSSYLLSLQQAEQQGKGLRIKLRVQPPELASLPWEFLYDTREGDYVVLSRHTPLVRYPDTPLPEQPLTVSPPLRILGMVAAPKDQLPLDIAREQERIATALRPLRDAGVVQLTWLEGQSADDLARALINGSWHVFHFVGHGGFSTDADEGFIALTGPDGATEQLGARELGRLLNDHPSLRLALLNACEGARGSERDNFSSIAATLICRGVPAVVAMQYEITDEAAVEFARSFYRVLADGVPLEGTVAEARKAVARKLPNTLEWAVPVLYLRSSGGNLFDIQPRPRRPRRLLYAALALPLLLLALGFVIRLLASRFDSPVPSSSAAPSIVAQNSPMPSTEASATASPSAEASAVSPSAEASVALPSVVVEPGAPITASTAAWVGQAERFGNGVITDAAWAPDGRTVAVASSIGVYLLDAASLEQLRLISLASVSSVVFAPDGQTIAVGSGDRSAHIYRVADGELLQTMAGHRAPVLSVAYSSDGALLATGSDDNTVRIWNVADGAQLNTIEGHTSRIRSVAFSPDGRLLASGSEDYTVRLWQVADGAPAHAPLTNGSGVFAVAWSPDGQTVAATSFDGNARIWNAADAALLRELPGHPGGALGLAFAPDGATLATTAFGDHVARIWDVANGQVLRELRRHTALVPAIAYAPDGAQLLTGSWDGTLQLWQTADGAAGLTQPGWTSRALAVAASPIQPIAAVAYFDGMARSLSTVDGAAQATLDAHSGSVNCIAFLPDGDALATAGEDGMIRLWRIANGEKIGEIDGAGGAIRSLAVDNAGEVVAAVGADGRVRQWHLADGAPVGVEIGDPISNATSVAFAPDGTLAVGFARGRIHLYNLAALQPRLCTIRPHGYRQ